MRRSAGRLLGSTRDGERAAGNYDDSDTHEAPSLSATPISSVRKGSTIADTSQIVHPLFSPWNTCRQHLRQGVSAQQRRAGSTEWSRRAPRPRASGQSSCPCACLRRHSDLAQSANRVLSEVLVYPPALLSATPKVCPVCLAVARGHSRRLVDLMLGCSGEFDGEQACTQACRSKGSPAQRDGWSGRRGVGSARHRSQLITLVLPAIVTRSRGAGPNCHR